ncbi:RNA polymerase sigma factor [Flavicella sediminum]|uniref:RNA polymerase sigma factor n=1 Tax=Flavicella sediminum TaxID=2585141 RepID=UPI00111E382E|nr:sigma-70 family RNA polymerase sigma factor [Flavicella sediminum]
MTKQEIHLIIEAKEGKQAAFKALLNLYWNDIYLFQLSRIHDENLAEDITIQTFSKAFDKIALYKESYNFKTWLLTISKNLQIDELRKKKTPTVSLDNDPDRSHHISDDTPTPEDQLIIEQNLAQLLRYIKQLKPHYQKVINLRYFQELSYKEISEELNEPMNNIKVKILRAKKLLSEIIKTSKNLE